MEIGRFYVRDIKYYNEVVIYADGTIKIIQRTFWQHIKRKLSFIRLMLRSKDKISNQHDFMNVVCQTAVGVYESENAKLIKQGNKPLKYKSNLRKSINEIFVTKTKRKPKRKTKVKKAIPKYIG